MATINGDGLRTQTREFGTFMSSLTELKDWLLNNGITHIAIESTGVYWKPVYHVFEPSGLTVWIVNVRHIKYVLGLIRLTSRIVPGFASYCCKAKLYSGPGVTGFDPLLD